MTPEPSPNLFRSHFSGFWADLAHGGGPAENPSAASLADKFLERLTGSWMTPALYAAAELGIADLLKKGPKTCEELAADTGTHAPSLRRLLQALTTIDICKELENDSFALAPMGSLLETDNPASLRSWTIWWGAYLWPVWGNLLHSVKTGESARKLLTGKDGFKHLEQDPRAAEVFYQAMAELTRISAPAIVRAYDFSDIERIVDVGGGYGKLLISILKAHPGVRGMLFDLPGAIENSRHRVEEEGLISRCELLVGDFFESVPGGADAYILKSVIHDWDDEKSERILENCRRAMAGRARLLLVERILPNRPGVSAASQADAKSDLTMLVALGGRERTQAEFRDLLRKTGLRLTRVLPTGTAFSILEAFSF